MEMKVLQALEVFFPYVDGVVNVMDNYAIELTKQGAECIVLTSNVKPKEYDYQKLPYKVMKCGAFLPTGYKKMRVPTPRLTIGLRKKIKKEQFDIFHIHSPFLFARYLQKIAKRQKIPTVVTFHTKYREDIERSIKLKFLQKFVMKRLLKSFEQADAVWAVNKAAAEELRDYGYRGDVTIMPNGTDFVYPEHAHEKRTQTRNKCNIGEDTPLFLFVGRLFAYKNLFLICDALKVLKDKGQKFKMLFIGEGDDAQALQDYIYELGLSEEVSLVGFVGEKSKIRDYFLAADLFLFPSTFDTIGLVMLEAATCKLPALLIKGSAAAEGLVDGVNVVLSEENAQDYADKILDTINGDRLKTIGENAAWDIPKSWESLAGDILENYCKIISDYKQKRLDQTK